MGDHPGFLPTNPRHIHKRVSSNRSNRSPPPYKKKKQLMTIVAGLKLNK